MFYYVLHSVQYFLSDGGFSRNAYILKIPVKGCKCADGLVAMTGAFQALNPGSNPGWRILFFC